jgi:hypothetical protein
VHVPYYADEQTAAVSVGLLLGSPGASPADLAGPRPLPGRNFVLAADQATLVHVLQVSGATATPLPLLVYLSANVSLGGAAMRGAALAVARPLLLVGKATDVTSVDLGMEVGSLVLGARWGALTVSRCALENLAPGDARAAALAGPHALGMSFNLWAVAFNRCARAAARACCVVGAAGRPGGGRGAWLVGPARPRGAAVWRCTADTADTGGTCTAHHTPHTAHHTPHTARRARAGRTRAARRASGCTMRRSWCPPSSWNSTCSWPRCSACSRRALARSSRA